MCSNLGVSPHGRRHVSLCGLYMSNASTRLTSMVTVHVHVSVSSVILNAGPRSADFSGSRLELLGGDSGSLTVDAHLSQRVTFRLITHIT